MTRKKYIMGIAIDEFVDCSLATYRRGRLDRLTKPQRSPPLRGGDQVQKIRRAILEFFAGLRPQILREVETISISTIGIIDDSRPSIARIARPTWRDVSIDLGNLITEAFAHRGIRIGPTFPKMLVYNDATCAAVGEFTARARQGGREGQLSKGIQSFIRIGDGINVGLLVDGRPWRGRLHPEMGHMRPRLHLYDTATPFRGVCEYHLDCVEGLASKEAWRKRENQAVSKFTSKLRLEIQASYIAQLCAALIVSIAPNRIVIGGSLADEKLVIEVRKQVIGWVRSYPAYAAMDDMESYIQEAKLKAFGNLLGILTLGIPPSR